MLSSKYTIGVKPILKQPILGLTREWFISKFGIHDTVTDRLGHTESGLITPNDVMAPQFSFHAELGLG